MPLKLSIIIPALNEEDNIANTIHNCLSALDDLNINGELLCINDGSNDNTFNIIKKKSFIDSRIRVINHEKPFGFGGSFWHGVDNAKGDVVTVIPGDNENDPWETFRYINLLNEVDFVIPFVFNKHVRSLKRRLLSFIFTSIINFTFRTRLNYTNGTVIYKLAILKKLNYRSSSFFFQTDILIRLIKTGYMFAEVPYRLGMRKSNISKAITFPSLFQVICGYIILLKDSYNKKISKEIDKKSITFKRKNINRLYKKNK